MGNKPVPDVGSFIDTDKTTRLLQRRPTRKRFAPLDPTVSNPTNAPSLKGIIFDVDGTLCEPQTWMFSAMRNVLSIPKGVDILSHIESLPDPSAAMAKIQAIEREAMASQVPSSGLVELMKYLDSRGIKKGICTRNFDAPVLHLCEKWLADTVFEPIVTRDNIKGLKPKPAPEGLWHIARAWGEEGGEACIMVGDSMDDMAAGRSAGAATVLLLNSVNGELAEHEYTDCVVTRLDDLIQILENGFEEVNRTKSAGAVAI